MLKLATLALGFALAATVSPSFAEGADRAQAIHDCNAASAKYSEHLWGNVGRQAYKACMAERGQSE
jgi:hypothetical protein